MHKEQTRDATLREHDFIVTLKLFANGKKTDSPQ